MKPMGDEGNIDATADETDKQGQADVYEYTVPGCATYRYQMGLILGLNKPQPKYEFPQNTPFGGGCKQRTIVEPPRVPRVLYVDDDGMAHIVADRTVDKVTYEDIDLRTAYPQRTNPNDPHNDWTHGWDSDWADEFLKQLFDHKIEKCIFGGTEIYIPFKEKKFIAEINVQNSDGDSIELDTGSTIYYTDGSTGDISGDKEPIADHKGVKAVKFVIPADECVAEITLKYYSTVHAFFEGDITVGNIHISDPVSDLQMNVLPSDTDNIPAANRDNLGAGLTLAKLLGELPISGGVGDLQLETMSILGPYLGVTRYAFDVANVPFIHGVDVAYEDTDFTDPGGSHYIDLDVNNDLGRNGHDGYFINDGDGDIQVAISDGTGFGSFKTIKKGERLQLEKYDIDTIRVLWIQDSSYRSAVL